MKFQKFENFLKDKTIAENNAMAFKQDQNRLTFNKTFANDDPKDVEAMILKTGRWNSVQQFITDPDIRKYAFLRRNGAENFFDN